MNTAQISMFTAAMALAMQLAVAASGSEGKSSSVPIEQKRPDARQDWVMHCQGCHLSNADGVTDRVPALSGTVSKFLHDPEGRAYLARVPGVAFAPLPDDRLARLLNWTVQTFDPVHLPVDFAPYTAEEVKRLRASALVGQANTVRQGLIVKLATDPPDADLSAMKSDRRIIHLDTLGKRGRSQIVPPVMAKK